jgi:hypothetical protein
MFARTLIVAGALVLALGGAAAAQTVVTGTVNRIDEPASVIVLQDGRMVRVPGGAVLINGQPTAISSIQPGTLVAIQNGQVVVYQNGVYVAADPRRAPYEVSGRVTLIDSVDNVLVLDGLRPIALTPDMQVFQDGRQVAVDSVRPGGYVTIASVSPIPFSGRSRDRVVAATRAPTTTVVTPAPSAPVSYTGTVARIDSDTIVLSDGRRIPTTAQTVVLVDNQAVSIANLAPGTQVVVYPNGQPTAVTASQPVVTSSDTRVITTPNVVVPPEPVKLQGGLREFEASRQAI